MSEQDEILDELVRLGQEQGLYDDGDPFWCSACGRSLPCRHCDERFDEDRPGGESSGAL